MATKKIIYILIWKIFQDILREGKKKDTESVHNGTIKAYLARVIPSN